MSPLQNARKIILNCLLPVIDPALTPQQAGFCPGKICTGQLLNLKTFIEDGLKAHKVTGVVFLRLLAVSTFSYCQLRSTA